jgi:hypothetical protein
MKSKLSSLVKATESDNIKITYSDIKVSGFPFVWKVQLLDPKISLTDEIKTNEFLSKHLSIIFNYKLTEAQVNFDKSISFRDSRDTNTQSYDLVSLGEELLVDLKFEKPIFLLNNSELSGSLKSIKINNSGFSVNLGQAQMFSVSNASLVFDKTVSEKLENINIKASSEYKSENSPFKFQNANISADIDYVTNLEPIGKQEANVSFERSLNITKWESTFDNSSLGFKGNVGFSRNKLPEGEIAIWVTGYPELIDIIVPDEFIVSGMYLKKLIARIVNIVPGEGAEGDAKFKIKLGVDGATVGGVNLLQLGE